MLCVVGRRRLNKYGRIEKFVIGKIPGVDCPSGKFGLLLPLYCNLVEETQIISLEWRETFTFGVTTHQVEQIVSEVGSLHVKSSNHEVPKVSHSLLL
jgi:hypothetical protein